MEESQKLLLERAQRTFPDPQLIVDAGQRVRQVTGGTFLPGLDPEGLAQEAMELLRDGMELSPEHRAALVVMISITRPAPLTKNGQVDALRPECRPTFPLWDDFRERVRPFLYSIGRIERVSDKQTIGTGFMVGPNLLATNRHVLDDLSHGAYALQKGQAEVFFKSEWNVVPDEPPVPITGVAAFSTTADISLLQLEERDSLKGRSPLRTASVPAQASLSVAAIGYPSEDPRSPMFTGTIFGKRWNVKRVAPGEITSLAPKTIFHDCSTLGGNSGSPVVSMESCEVVGLHREGHYMYYNEAADALALTEFLQPYV